MNDLRSVLRGRQDARTSHSGRDCQHSYDVFENRRFSPPEPEISWVPSSFDYEFALPHGDMAWTHLLCPNEDGQSTNRSLGSAHPDDIVITVGTAKHHLNLSHGEIERIVGGIWYGPQDPNAVRLGKNKVFVGSDISVTVALVIAARDALNAVMDWLIKNPEGKGGRVIIKTSLRSILCAI